ncbi:MAG: WD40 repeat domain-containing protein [Gemmataceae bacterium]
MGTGKPKAILKGHQGPVFAVNFSPNGNILASGSEDTTIKLWDVSNLR